MNKVGTIKISCLGDLLPSDTFYNIGHGIGSRMSKIIEQVANSEFNPFINKDVVLCNLEAPLYENPQSRNQAFAGNSEILELFKLLNIKVVSVANNHILDHGLEGFHRTIDLLKGNGFLPIGLLENGISNILSLEQKSKKFVFSAFNCIHDHPENKLIAPLDREVLNNTLDEIHRTSPDCILFSFHWGNEYVNYPSPEQVELAHELIDKGVNIIIGHHPHVVQPIEKYNNGLIIYSLGNFLFDMLWSEPVRNSMFVDLIFDKELSVDYNINPFRITSDFTQDYSKHIRTLSMISKYGVKFNRLKSGSREAYIKEYRKECKKRRFRARLRMKIYLLKNFISLSPLSRSLLFNNVKLKLSVLWKSK